MVWFWSKEKEENSIWKGCTFIKISPWSNYKRFILQNNKEYAKLRKFQKEKKFRQNILNKLDDLYSNNPKEYKKLVSSLRENDNEKDNFVNFTDGDTWYEYFASLSKILEYYKARIGEIEQKIQQIVNSQSTSFTNLDFKIASSELQKAIDRLKSVKSPGLDSISNEMLKTAQLYINPCLLKLFNAVFSAGIYQEKWLEGYTTPIF